ncbi:MAG: hypothetical protein ACI83B_003024 [Sediminicola sp.]|jgi:hypothetical protein
MSNSWHKTLGDIEAENHSANFWTKHAEDLSNGEFWADRIKKYRGEPAKRLKLALENMPLPASFREAAIATRALIREKRKAKEPYNEQLQLLYWLAAIDSFSIPSSEKLGEPGYNVIESIPGEKLKSLPFSFKQLGYKDLSLLNKTDVKWLIETWGEPEAHTTLHKLHFEVWEEYEDKLKLKRNSDPFNLYYEEPEPLPKVQIEHQAKTDMPKKSSGNNKNLLFIVGCIIIVVLIFVVKG